MSSSLLVRLGDTNFPCRKTLNLIQREVAKTTKRDQTKYYKYDVKDEERNHEENSRYLFYVK